MCLVDLKRHNSTSKASKVMSRKGGRIVKGVGFFLDTGWGHSWYVLIMCHDHKSAKQRSRERWSFLILFLFTFQKKAVCGGTPSKNYLSRYLVFPQVRLASTTRTGHSRGTRILTIHIYASIVFKENSTSSEYVFEFQ